MAGVEDDGTSVRTIETVSLQGSALLALLGHVMKLKLDDKRPLVQIREYVSGAVRWCTK